MGTFFAHSTGNTSCDDWHRLNDHLNSVAEMAGRFGRAFGGEKAASLAGLLHDLGKYSQTFQARLHGAGERVDHATAGAVEVGRLAEGGSDPWDRIIAELVAYAIAGHHAGLPDKIGSGGSLADRLKKDLDPLDPVWREEIVPEARGLKPPLQPNKRRLEFQLGFLGRMIFSCLVDADYRDTEAFYAHTEERRVDREWPALGTIIDRLIAAFDRHMTEKQAKADTTNLNALRRNILSEVRQGAGKTVGLFTLTVPTGGGKTLASLAFALDHAKRHGLERIIYAIPFTSVIDQTASVFREVLGNDVILEHHSAIDEEENRARESRDKLKLAMEDWAAPIVVTTNVQLFESLFANRPSRCRKLHNIARSVIVLDEAQTIPLPLLRPCVAALDELARNYGATVVLCTATQPALAAPEFEDGLSLGPDRELAPDPHRLSQELKRVTIERAGEITDEDLLTALGKQPQGLVIVNSRAHALALFRIVKDAGLDGVIHLTTRQYAAHRRRILEDIRQRLKSGLPCRLIATSLVEAGVDLDFPRVWRAEAGLDQITQAAGRCNREGVRNKEDSIVTVFTSPDYPTPREIRQLAGDFGRMASNHQNDLLSLAAMRDYFREVYWRKGERLDAKGIIEKFKMSGGETDFSYRTVADEFRMIESGLVPIIIARDAAARASLAKLRVENVHPGSVARDLQPYVVQVPPKARALLCSNAHVAFVEEKRCGDQFAVLRTDSLYRDEIGLLWENADYLGLEDSII